ncbi:GNAT family N-acetyltransferase [Gymnodinialimonas sp. 2305UL16-5]|uniref:GNAT family N-acetyltransferase n=1 Tax=Gymnodinialimonas mytili TaxID=3126503 RepID=UPI0030A654F4
MIQVRAFGPGQEDAFLTLYRACLDHYKVGPARPEIEAEILDDLHATRGMSADLAFHDGRAIGFSTWVKVYPAANGIALYLKELFVIAEARGLGAGKALMGNLVQTADQVGAVRLDWGSFQPEALKFYDTLGATREEKVHFSVKRHDFDRFMQ